MGCPKKNKKTIREKMGIMTSQYLVLLFIKFKIWRKREDFERNSASLENPRFSSFPIRENNYFPDPFHVRIHSWSFAISYSLDKSRQKEMAEARGFEPLVPLRIH